MEQDQATEDSGGSWWDSVTNAASSAVGAVGDVGASAVNAVGGAATDAAGGASSTWENVKELGKGAANMLPDILESGIVGSAAKDLAEGIPAIGALPAVIAGMGDSDASADARRDAMLHEDDKERVAMDRDKDAFYKGREDYDLASAIPLVGVATGIGEAAAGVYNWGSGGEGGYKEGSETFKDMCGDFLDNVTNPDGSVEGGASHTPVQDTGWGARGELRKRYEEEAKAQGMEP
jgi:hypothetical protein